MNGNKECVVLEDSEMRNLEAAKSATLKALVQAGLLAQEVAEEFYSTHGIVAYKEAWYKNIFKSADKDALLLQCIKMAPCPTENSTEEQQ